MMFRVMVMGLLAVLSATKPAYSLYCTEPSNPNCPYLGSFTDQFEFEMCKSRMEIYSRDVSNYLECTDRQKRDALETYNRAVKKFNCAAKGNTVCY